MRLIVGLGNKGERFSNTRHNVGFMIIDSLAIDIGVNNWSEVKKLKAEMVRGTDLVLAKPTVLMNSSGDSVKKLVDHFKIKMPDLWIIHDDLDLRLGSYKVNRGKGPRLHKGTLSIEGKLAREDFWRVRVGVDNREKESRIPGEAYVLQRFTKEELAKITEVIDKITKEIRSNLGI